ncbi:hypothetical protein FRC04_006945 [Tulasnella sp. 424]|nr:hypothetical protein FRC04_006945 [Tulasnella sp. 424]
MDNQPWPPSNPFSTHVPITPEYPQYPPGHPRPVPHYPLQPQFSQPPQYPPGHPLPSQQSLAYPSYPQTLSQNWAPYGNQANNAPIDTGSAHTAAEEPITKKRKHNTGKKQNTTGSLLDEPPQPRKRARKANTSTQANKESPSHSYSTSPEVQITPVNSSGVGPMINTGTPNGNPPISSSIQTPAAAVLATSDPTTQAASTSSSQVSTPSQGSQPTKNLIARAASDCWAFLRPLETRQKLAEMPNLETEEILAKPSAPWVGCKLCKAKWTTWKCADGMTTHYRKHFASKHWDEWVQLCKEKSLPIKGKWAAKAGFNPQGESAPTNGLGSGGLGQSTGKREPFNLDGFLAQLVRWLVSDDQSVNVIENPFFRKLLVFVSNGALADDDIPHRTKVTSLIKSAAALEQQHMRKEMQLGYITLDNASNCDTLVDQISEELEALQIGFSQEQNWLRELPPDIAAIYSGNDLARLQQLLDEESFEEDIVHRIRGSI